jgi:glycosyltransferase involved in cell wall biosynthesis
MPEAGFGGDLSTRHALDIDTYDMYCGHTCSLIAVDAVAASQVFLRLIQSSELRSTMGEAGKKRAVEFFDWRQIIPRYGA